MFRKHLPIVMLFLRLAAAIRHFLRVRRSQREEQQVERDEWQRFCSYRRRAALEATDCRSQSKPSSWSNARVEQGL